MHDYSQTSPDDIAAAVKGKTVEGVSVDDSSRHVALLFRFTDGWELRLEYFWIYGWEVKESGAAPPSRSSVRVIIEEDSPKVIGIDSSDVYQSPVVEEESPKDININTSDVYQVPVTRQGETFLSVANRPLYGAARCGDYLHLHGSRYVVLAVKNLGSALRFTVERAGHSSLDQW